jgi:uncharacterized protein YndB with AHSA1/START domain
VKRPRRDKASRAIAAAPVRIFAALTEAKALEQWLPPEGMTGRILAFEPREGGRYRMELRYDAPPEDGGKSGADTDLVEGRFVTLKPNILVVQAADFESGDAAFAGTMTIRWEIAARPEGTQVTVIASDVPPGIPQDVHEEALASSLANLARFVGG